MMEPIIIALCTAILMKWAFSDEKQSVIGKEVKREKDETMLRIAGRFIMVDKRWQI